MKEQLTTKHLRLPFRFNQKKLVDDLQHLTNTLWIPHFNTTGYSGSWQAIPLYAPNGDVSNIFAAPNAVVPIKETALLKSCTYFKEVLATFKCEILSARILKLNIGAVIKPHKDHELGYEDGNFRLHIPITTNKDVRFILDGERLQMSPGECWYTNVNYTHSVSNTGTCDRVHLVVDGKRNNWSDTLFFSLAPKEQLTLKPIKEESLATARRMIDELQLSKLPVAKNLILALQEKHQIL